MTRGDAHRSRKKKKKKKKEGKREKGKKETRRMMLGPGWGGPPCSRRGNI